MPSDTKDCCDESGCWKPNRYRSGLSGSICPVSESKDQTDQMEILLGNGRIIRIRPGFDSESLHQALMVAEAS
jgi:hypothetical protein